MADTSNLSAFVMNTLHPGFWLVVVIWECMACGSRVGAVDVMFYVLVRVACFTGLLGCLHLWLWFIGFFRVLVLIIVGCVWWVACVQDLCCLFELGSIHLCEFDSFMTSDSLLEIACYGCPISVYICTGGVDLYSYRRCLMVTCDLSARCAMLFCVFGVMVQFGGYYALDSVVYLIVLVVGCVMILWLFTGQQLY
eukprot:gene3542-2493_t